MKMNTQTKLVFALEHVAHLHDLIEDNEWGEFLQSHLIPFEYEIERQLANELHRKNPQLGRGVQEISHKETIQKGIGNIGRIGHQDK